jgi:multisubunit Na+/H+ antiporter MnhC subunit
MELALVIVDVLILTAIVIGLLVAVQSLEDTSFAAAQHVDTRDREDPNTSGRVVYPEDA